MAAAPAEGLLIFNATAQSWVRVTDSRGATVFEKTLESGASQVANGTPPLNVVVGNAGATTVRLRGQAFDLSAITRNNVARFEVR
jgi:cytoskeleton protein RodZ